MKKPLLCKLGLHKSYRSLPRVSGILGKSLTCSRCGWGKNLFDDKWDIKPENAKVEPGEEVRIQYGQILTWFRGFEPLKAMELALNALKPDFTESEIKPLKDEFGILKKQYDEVMERYKTHSVKS